MLTNTELRKLPKVELHRHLEGSVRFETIRRLAQYHHLDLGVRSDAELRSKTLVDKPMKSLEDVLAAFWTTQKVFCAYEAIKQITLESIEDAFNDGIRLLELRFAPVFMAHGKSLSPDEITEGVLDGVKAGLAAFDMQVGLIHILPRGLDTDLHAASTDSFIRYKQSSHACAYRLCGFDLADSERSTRPEDYAEFTERARSAGAGITIHTGEDTDADHVRRTIEVFNPQRLGHGIKSSHDDELMLMLKERNIHLELCPTSNWLTQSVDSIENHPLRKFYDAGIPFSINSDDPHLMGIDLLNEYHIAHRLFGLDGAQLYRLNQRALEHSFLDEEVKQFTRKSWFAD